MEPVQLVQRFEVEAPSEADVPSEADARSEADVLLWALILEGKFGRMILGDVLLPGYPAAGDVLLPLGELSRSLDLAIEVDVAAGEAKGFVIDEDRSFHVDLRAGTVKTREGTSPLDPIGIELHPDDLYVATRLLSQWLPIDFVIDSHALTITVRPRELLPLELRMARQRRQYVNRDPDPPQYEPMDLSYRPWDGPFTDATVSLQSVPDSRGDRRTIAVYSSHLSADLLYMTSNLNVVGTDEGFSRVRLSLGRKTPEGDLLGPLRAREFTLGETLYPAVDLIAFPGAGPGLRLSNDPLVQPSRFNEHDFRGDVPPGWEVELYHNDALVGYQDATPDGRYEFNAIPVLFGMNEFRLVFYGPHGEQREERRAFNVGETLATPGDFSYRLVANDSESGGARSLFEVDLGLTTRASASLGMATLQRDDGRHDYARTGLRGFWGRIYGTLDLAADLGGGFATKAGVHTRVGPLGLSAQHARLHDFQSEVFEPVFGPIRSRTVLRADGRAPGIHLPILLELRSDEIESRGTVHSVTTRVSGQPIGVWVSNELRWTFGQGDSHLPEHARGILLASKRLPRFAVRGELAYDLEPGRRIDAVALTAERWLPQGLLGSFGVNRQIRSRETHYIAGVSKLQGAYGLGFSMEYSKAGGFSSTLSLTVGLSRDSRTGRWESGATSVAGAGGLSARVFLDANQNGLLDDGEEPLEGVGFSVDGSLRPVSTGRDGIAFMNELPADRSVAIAISPSTLEDPLWLSTREGVQLVPRPGRVAMVDFPVVVSGDLTGTVYVWYEGEKRAKGGIQLELVDESRIVEKTVTAFDGFYEITSIPPGRYMLRVPSEQMIQLGLELPPPLPIVIGPSGTTLEGVDWVLGTAADTPLASGMP